MAGEDLRYSAWIKRLPCCAPGCAAAPPSHVHHRTGAGMALRAHDHDAMPLCPKHHRAFHDGREPFMGWGKALLRDWQAAMIRVLRAAYLTERPISAELEDAF